MTPLGSPTTPQSPLTSRTALLRGSGVLGMISGVCWALETLFHPVRNITTLVEDAKASRWELVYTIGLLGFVLALFALIGFYLIQRVQSGFLGLSGFVLLFTGLALGIGGYSPDAYVFPVLAKHSTTATLLLFSGPLLSGTLGKLLAASALFQVLGYTLFGLASLRAKILSPWGTWLVKIGFVLTNLPILDAVIGIQTAYLLSNLGAILFGVGYIWWSAALWAHPMAGARTSPPTKKEEKHG
ncbi:MAG TPA: hypothetical protein VF844_06880 [Ktedonobacteraceae bacterium]